jgi:hypothetical protein
MFWDLRKYVFSPECKSALGRLDGFNIPGELLKQVQARFFTGILTDSK